MPEVQSDNFPEIRYHFLQKQAETLLVYCFTERNRTNAHKRTTKTKPWVAEQWTGIIIIYILNVKS